MTTHQRRRNGKRALIALIVTLGLLGGLVAAGAFLWSEFGDRVSLALGWTSDDYAGDGAGEVLVTITSGEIGEDIAASLAKANVVKTSAAFYRLLLEQDPAVEFQPGTYRLRLEMSSVAALSALQDPANRMELTVTIPEGTRVNRAFELVSGVTDIPLDDFTAANADPQRFGLPAEAVSLEGYLFPATYAFVPGDTADTVVQTMIARMQQALAEHAVPAGDEYRVLTLASVIQLEAGSNPEDYPKIARVFLNRLDQGVLLQSDATVAYGTGNTQTVWTTPAERADAGNLWNTYALPGLPVGPIGMPGDVAISAAMNPVDGPWMFFMPINLETGETAYAVTGEEHEVNVQRLAEWCTQARAKGQQYCE
jgi:UPF0755 protein